MKKGKSKTHPIFQLKNPWALPTHTVWLASTLGVSRNLKNFKFPGHLDGGRQAQVLSLLWEAFQSAPQLHTPTLYRTPELDPIQREFLLEHFLIPEGFLHTHAGDGFVVDESATLLAMINIHEHLHMVVLDTQQELESSWNRLVHIESHLGKSLDFAFNPRFGFLTADPHHAGTGLRVTLYLHIPAIIHMGELPELLEHEKEEEVAAVGLQGKTSEMIGDILLAHNTCTLGLSEEYILTSMRMWATRAVVAELNVRKKILATNEERIKNKVMRALGLLSHSYQLEVIELLNAVSLVKLGVELGWIEAPPTLNLTDTLFHCRRAHLIGLSPEAIAVPELPRHRAEYARKLALQLVLKI